MVRRPRPWQLILAATLSLGASCGFDTAPLHGQSTAGAAALSESGAEVAGSAGRAGQEASPTVRSSSAAAGAGAGGSTPPSPIAGTGGVAAPVPSAAPSAPATTPPAVGMPSPAPTQAPTCDAVGSYGLRMTADLAWEGTNGLTEAGRGPVQIFAWVDVRRVDPQSGALEGEAQVCGLALPALNSPFGCSPFELRFADKLWERRELPHTKLTGAYTCAADGCKLQLAPAFTLGIQLDPTQPAWPAAGSTLVSQYPDDDGDGQPGLSADIITLGTGTSGPGNGNANGNANPGCSYTPFGTSAGGASTGESDNGRALLGVRAQLAAALSLAPDCHITTTAGDLQSLALRAGGCELRNGGWTSGPGGMGPMTGNSGNAGNEKSPCSEELRNAMDESLPSYQVLASGQAPPPPSMTGSVRDMSPSQGPQLRAVRFLPGVKPSCEQVRKAMY